MNYSANNGKNNLNLSGGKLIEFDSSKLFSRFSLNMVLATIN